MIYRKLLFKETVIISHGLICKLDYFIFFGCCVLTGMLLLVWELWDGANSPDGLRWKWLQVKLWYLHEYIWDPEKEQLPLGNCWIKEKESILPLSNNYRTCFLQRQRSTTLGGRCTNNLHLLLSDTKLPWISDEWNPSFKVMWKARYIQIFFKPFIYLPWPEAAVLRKCQQKIMHMERQSYLFKNCFRTLRLNQEKNLEETLKTFCLFCCFLFPPA